jgi:hypothetical protein
MNRTPRYVAEFVESFPTPMEPGILYISSKYSTAGHLCPCGCGREVVTKLSPARWRITLDGEVSLWPSVAATGLPCDSHYFITRGEVVTKLSPARWRITLDGEVSLWPSVAATGLPCDSHYFITRGEVDWRLSLTGAQAARAREADRHAVDKHRATDDGLAKRLWRRLRARR